MRLTPEQQRLAEEASKLVPICRKVFLQQMPCLYAVAVNCDLESAAYLACCKAARTFDPDRGIAITTYFSVAIRNAMLREVQKELKTQSHSIKRISLEAAASREPPATKQADVALAAIMTLTEEERDWIESFVFENKSFRAFGRQANCDPRTAKKLIRSRLAKLKDAVDDVP